MQYSANDNKGVSYWKEYAALTATNMLGIAVSKVCSFITHDALWLENKSFLSSCTECLWSSLKKKEQHLTRNADAKIAVWLSAISVYGTVFFFALNGHEPQASWISEHFSQSAAITWPSAPSKPCQERAESRSKHSCHQLKNTILCNILLPIWVKLESCLWLISC